MWGHDSVQKSFWRTAWDLVSGEGSRGIRLQCDHRLGWNYIMASMALSRGNGEMKDRDEATLPTGVTAPA
jgi:hypothetical protein